MDTTLAVGFMILETLYVQVEAVGTDATATAVTASVSGLLARGILIIPHVPSSVLINIL